MTSKRTSSLLIAGFLLLQVLLPIRGLAKDKFDTWGEFSWNMYSQTYQCRTRYQLVDRSGATQELDLRPYFVDPGLIGHVFNRQHLPVLHRFLCAQMAREGRPGRILARVSCTRNKVKSESLVREGEDVCTSANNSVTAE